MIELEKLKAVNHVIVHDNCPDGVASAMVLKDVLPNAQVTFCQYETDLQKNMPAKPGMLFADFSPHRSRVQDFLDAGAIVLDHHGGAAAIVTKAFVEKGLGAFADEKKDPGICGATLAYREVWHPLWEDALPQGLPSDREQKREAFLKRFAEIAGIRDTWQRYDSWWQQACDQGEALRFWPWEKISTTPWDKWESELLSIGPVLSARNLKHVEKCIEASYKFTSGKGRRITVFEGLKPSSDAAEMMGSSNDLTIGFGFMVEDGKQKMIFSTRARGEFNCQGLATAMGGGGHLKAAGFSVQLTPGTSHPYELAEAVLNNYENLEDQWLAIMGEEGFLERVKNGEVDPKAAYASLQQSLKATSEDFSHLLED